MKLIIYFYCFYHIQTISTCFKYKIKVYFYHSVAYSIGHIIQVGVGGGEGGAYRDKSMQQMFLITYNLLKNDLNAKNHILCFYETR